jgi:hypothetical protein
LANSFSSFKENFYSKFASADIFDCGDFNSLKIVLDGLKVNYNQYQIPESYFRFNWLTFKTYRSLKRYFYWNQKYKGQLQTTLNELSKNKKYYVGDSPRTLKGAADANYSQYYTHIIETLGAENCLFVTKDNNRKNKIPHIDLLIEEIYAAANCFALDKEDKALFEALKNNHHKLSQLGIFNADELNNILKAYDNFFHQAFIWNNIFKRTQLTHVIATVHYHREGMIYAARKNNMKVIELQHGLIAHEDIFYHFPQQVNSVITKALFADKILVYGDVWKNRLLAGCEYKKEQIEILGFYHYQYNLPQTADQQLLETIGDKKMLLFTSQTYMEKQFINYIQSFEERISDDYLIVIKPHPLEKRHFYTEAFDKHPKIFLSETNLDFLFQHAHCNITCYSTTVFDALRHGIKSIAINFENCADYVQGFVDAGVVVRVQENEWVTDVLPLLQQLNCNADDWYQSYSPEVLLKAVR